MNQTSLLFQVLKQVHFNLEKRIGEYIFILLGIQRHRC